MKHKRNFRIFIRKSLISGFFALTIFSYASSVSAFNPINSLITAYKSYLTPVVRNPNITTVVNEISPVTKVTTNTVTNISDASILASLKRLLSQPNIQNLLRGPVGPQGTAGLNGSNATSSGQTTFSPINYIQPNPLTNYNGTTILSAANLSSTNFTTNNASVNVLRFIGSNSGSVGFIAPADAGSTMYTLPNSDGTNGQVLSTNGSGQLSWITAAGGSGSSNYTNPNPTPISVGGIAAGSTFNNQTMQNMFDQLLYPYIAPSISLSVSPSTGVREFGNSVATVTMNATTTKHSNNITLVEFYRNGSLTHTQSSPIVGGGLETYTDTTPVTTNGITFTSKVGDGTQTITSNGASYTFVYPFYYGVGAQGLTGAQIRSTLTMLIKTPSNTTTTTSPVSQVFYLAYPNTSPALTSILDTNGFETLSDYTLRTVTITGLDGTPQTYKVYEYKNVTTQTNFTNTFKF